MCKGEVQQQIDEGDKRMDILASEIQGLRKDFNELRDEVTEFLDIFRASKGFFKVLGWIGKFVKWVVSIGLAIGAVWAMVKGFGK